MAKFFESAAHLIFQIASEESREESSQCHADTISLLKALMFRTTKPGHHHPAGTPLWRLTKHSWHLVLQLCPPEEENFQSVLSPQGSSLQKQSHDFKQLQPRSRINGLIPMFLAVLQHLANVRIESFKTPTPDTRSFVPYSPQAAPFLTSLVLYSIHFLPRIHSLINRSITCFVALHNWRQKASMETESFHEWKVETKGDLEQKTKDRGEGEGRGGRSDKLTNWLKRTHRSLNPMMSSWLTWSNSHFQLWPICTLFFQIYIYNY